MNILPLTAGLLISMAKRYDHSFGFNPASMVIFSSGETLIDKQIRLIRTAATYYKNLENSREGEIYKDPFSNQLLEEMTGEGFYKPELEDDYKSKATRAALNEAEQIANAVVTFDGPQPTITMSPVEVRHGWSPPTSPDNNQHLFFD